MTNREFLVILIHSISFLLGIFPCQAQISIQGVSDKKVYGDSITFRVNSETGYNYTARLNDSALDIDVDVTVNQPDYYELFVSRIDDSSHVEETELIQFIVRATERGNAENGLPKWTPYPQTPSAAAEFADARLDIITPALYPANLEIPVIGLVKNTDGKRIAINGLITAEGFAGFPLKLFRGVGSVFLPSSEQPGVISYIAQVETLEVQKQITIEENTLWQTISQDITASIEWGPNSRIHITDPADNSITISDGTTLTIAEGSVVVIDPGLEIEVKGAIVVNGAKSLPVVFTAFDRAEPWGGFLFKSASAQATLTGAIFTAGGADSKWFENNSGSGSSHRKDQCLFYLSGGAEVNLTDCYMVDNHGQIAHGENSWLTMTGCLVQKCTTVGQFNGGSVDLKDSAFIEFPFADLPYADGDNDGFYLTAGHHTITDCLIGWSLDDGIDAGGSNGDTVTVERCWFESCYHEGIAWSGTKIARVDDSVFLNCSQGIECGYDDPNVTVIKSLATSNLVGARFGDNYDWNYDNSFLTVTDSLLLFNYRDAWARAWDNWQLHLSQTDIRNNYLSAENSNHPENILWDPLNQPDHINALAAFISTPTEKVGIAFATNNDTFDYSEFPQSVPVRLSTFTTNPIYADYTIATDRGVYRNGSLLLIPGDTIEFISLPNPPTEDIKWIKVFLHDPVNADLTGYSQLTYNVPYDPEIALIVRGDLWRYFKGTTEPPVNWNDLSFNPANSPDWFPGPTGIGYESDSGYESKIETNLADMEDNYLSVYARAEFTIDDPAQVISLILYMHYDDGFIAYLNGHIVESVNPPQPALYDQPASGSHEACNAPDCTPDRFDISDYIDKLVPGINILALQVHNRTIGSSDFLFVPELKYETYSILGDFEPDGDVDYKDFETLSAAWLTQIGQDNYNPVCDISVPPDNVINIKDLAVFIQNWNP